MFAADKTAAASSGAVNYIEDVFSTYLYNGGGTQTITNNIDLSTKGGLVWVKDRSNTAGYSNGSVLVDTARGAYNGLFSSQDVAENYNDYVMQFFSTGFQVGYTGETSESGRNYVSWTLRKQPKFFDIQTWSGSGANRTISHSLGSVPACIMVKRTNAAGNWQVYHRSLANTEYLVLNTTAAKATGATRWNSTTPTSTVFSLGTDATVNASGGTYVAYIFAHDSAGFGLTGTDNVISCGSFTTDGSGNATVSLGYEPQWVLIKKSSAAGDWLLQDTMREMSQTNLRMLSPNTSDAENNFGAPYVVPTATGFNIINSYIGTSATAVYIAIRRGPMKVPTDATKVFSPRAVTEPVSLNTVDLGIVSDLILNRQELSAVKSIASLDRLRGMGQYVITSSNAAEASTGDGTFGAGQTSVTWPSFNATSTATIDWIFRRAPSFFDVVCYTGNSTSGRQITHNLTVEPELMINKSRSNVTDWYVYSKALGISLQVRLNSTAAQTSAIAGLWNSTAPTSSVFTVGNNAGTNFSGYTYVAYLFSTCAGVSKVGSYTGNGTTQTIDCGLTAGARFVLLKRTDAVGDWYVYDTARGMTTLTDPYLRLNSTAAESATLGSVTTVSTGFALNSAILSAINVSGGTYIFLAIA
jgi:hypothetical protein